MLIVAALSNAKLKKFIKIAKDINIDCIIEVHNEKELIRAMELNYPIIGINNRNLKNLDINMNNSLKLIDKIKNQFTIIAESGIKKAQDIEMYNNLGIYNFLIGETLIRSNNKEKIINSLLLND